MNLTVHHLLFTLRAQTLVHLGPQAGAQIRGGLWAALRELACAAPTIQGDPNHARHCPMCRLVALETAESARGVTPPRPFAVRPPLPASPGQDCVFQSGASFVVGINLYGEAVDSFPYLCQAFHRLGQLGLGYGRGQFTIERIQAVNPLSGATHDLLQGQRIVALPDLPVKDELVRQVAGEFPADRLRLRFLTPTELTCQGGHADRPYFDVLIARLLERCQALEQHYIADPTPRSAWQERYQSLTQVAQGVRLAEHRTRWVRVKSGSRRTQSVNAVSGFVGEAVVEGDLGPFREWLVWGASLHVGKNAVKGNGWYDLDSRR
jgi:hypothetical protein